MNGLGILEKLEKVGWRMLLQMLEASIGVGEQDLRRMKQEYYNLKEKIEDAKAYKQIFVDLLLKKILIDLKLVEIILEDLP